MDWGADHGRTLDSPPLSLEVAILATIVSVIIAIPLGTIAAIRQDTWMDYVVRVISIGGLAIPSFWTGIMIILFLVIFFEWGPAPGICLHYRGSVGKL